MPPVNPYATGVLLPSRHAGLVEKLSLYAADAGIRPEHVWTSMRNTEITDAEIDHLMAFRHNATNGIYGLVLVGKDSQRNIIQTMSLMAGFITRNHIRACVMALAELMDQYKEHGYPEHNYLFIPDFYVSSGDPGEVPKDWVSRLTGLLLHRSARSLQTVLHVSSMDELKLAYGALITQHLKTHFQFVELG